MERILFCPGKRMIVYDWENGRFGGVRQFSANAEGHREFEQYLQQSMFKSVQILVDLIEEEFHLDLVPFTRGSDRAALLDRTVKRYFRSSELRSLQIQARKKSGRRDQEVMISGLANAAILRQWMDILQRVRIPVRGIFSLPLVGQSLLPTLKAQKRRILLVSQQSPTTLRQSFYDNGHLKFSRLASHRMTRDGSIADVQHLETDIDNTLLYLRSQRLLQRNEPLDVYIVVRDELYEPLHDALKSADELVSYSIFRQQDIAKKIGIPGDLPTHYADGLFAHLLANNQRVKNHYAPRDLTHFYRYHQMRKCLWMVAGLVVIFGGTFTASRHYEVQLLQQYAKDAQVQERQYRARYLQRVGQVETYRLAPEAVKSTVNIINLLEGYSKVTPLQMMTGLAGAITRNNTIEVNKITWLVHPDSAVEVGAGSVLARSSIDGGLDAARVDYQVAKIAGQVVHYADNYRYAVEQFDSFVRDLSSSGLYSAVDVAKTPFDVGSETGLSGDSGTTATENLATRSTFTLRLTLNKSAALNQTDVGAQQ